MARYDFDLPTVGEYRENPEKVREADARWSGTLDGDTYAEIETALADLHDVDPDKLPTSDLLTRLYRLARICGLARAAELETMIGEDADAREADRLAQITERAAFEAGLA